MENDAYAHSCNMCNSPKPLHATTTTTSSNHTNQGDRVKANEKKNQKKTMNQKNESLRQQLKHTVPIIKYNDLVDKYNHLFTEDVPRHKEEIRRLKEQLNTGAQSKSTESAPTAVPPTTPSTPSPTRLQFRYHGFLTHTWMKDELGRPNHDRVTKIFEALKRKGLDNWFDGEKMQDDVMMQMIGGIDQSACIVVFVTKAYIEKVGSGNRADNCFKEFDYAYRKKPDRMIVVPMEPCCLNPNNWSGPVSMALGGLLYEANFANDDPAAFNENIEKLYQQIRRKCAQKK